MTGYDRPISDRRQSAGPAACTMRWLGVPLVTAVAVFGVLPVWERWPLTATAAVLTSTAWAATGAVLAAEPHRRGTAVLFFAVGLGWAAEWLDNRDYGPFPFLAYMSAPIYLACGAIAILRYTAERRLDDTEHRFGMAVAGWLITGRLGMALTSHPGRFDYDAGVWWPDLITGAGWYRSISTGYWAGAIVLAAGFLVLLGRNLRRAAHLDRWMLAPLMVAVVITVGTVAVRIPWRLVSPSATTPAVLVTAQTVGLLLVPIGFLASSVRRRLAPVSLADLVVSIAGRVTGEQLRDALRETLREPALDVYYPVPWTDRYVDAGGRDVVLADVAKGKMVCPVTSSDGIPLAVVITSPALAAHRRLLDSALSAGRLALENARLAAVAKAQLDEIRTAQTRLAEAGDAERRRIERDLHDRVQKRLVALSLRLAEGSADPATRTLLARARAELHASLDELRGLAHGVHPAVLTDGGLRPAVTDLAQRLPIPVAVEVPATRWPPAVEVAAYFVIAEALTNTVKHAGAASAQVRVTSDGPWLAVTVADDGHGGADVRAGTGLAGLTRRVRSLGGELVVHGDHGTEVAAVIPLERESEAVTFGVHHG